MLEEAIGSLSGGPLKRRTVLFVVEFKDGSA